jgi:hydrogenase expression/formation protein HypE
MSTKSPAVTGREQRVLQIIETARSKRARFRDKQITLAHGAGGKATQTLIEGLFVPAFAPDPASEPLAALADAGAVDANGTQIAITTDSFVVKPLRFPGGSIGELAVNGTVNDLAVSGARPIAITVSVILEEGLDSETKVVERGAADQMYICTTGIGTIDARAALAPQSIEPGDQILVSGPIGEHGTAIMLARNEFDLDAEIESDTCSLWPAVDALLQEVGPELRCLRDATRGGVASVLNELARASRVAVVVREADVPVSPVVRAAAELLGIDPMYVANEGRFVAFVAPEAADRALATLTRIPGCEHAAAIGEVKREPPGMVLVETSFGGRRVMDQLVGDPLPRIC